MSNHLGRSQLTQTAAQRWSEDGNGCSDYKLVAVQCGADRGLGVVAGQYLHIHPRCDITGIQGPGLGFHDQDEFAVVVLPNRAVGHDQVAR